MIVVAIQRANGHMDFNPLPEAAMNPGDHLVVLGRTESLRKLEIAASSSASVSR